MSLDKMSPDYPLITLQLSTVFINKNLFINTGLILVFNDPLNPYSLIHSLKNNNKNINQ